jgi:hypothetical protein
MTIEFSKEFGLEREISEALEEGDGEALIRIARQEKEKRERWERQQENALSPARIYANRRKAMASKTASRPIRQG